MSPRDKALELSAAAISHQQGQNIWSYMSRTLWRGLTTDKKMCGLITSGTN